MDLALNNLQRLICHKTQPTNLFYKDMSLTLTNSKNNNAVYKLLKFLSCLNLTSVWGFFS